MTLRPLHVLVVGQTPPPWGGQAVMMQHLLDSRLDGIRWSHVRMAFSADMDEIGRVKARKFLHLASVIARIILARIRLRPDTLYYAPAGPNRVPVGRDIAILLATRWMFRHTVFHFHASGLSELRPRLGPVARRSFDAAYNRPALAIQTSAANPPDGDALRSAATRIVENGLPDEWPRFTREALAARSAAHTPRILFVGALYENKGTGILADALALLARRGIAFEADFVGRPESEAFAKNLRDRIREANLDDRVRFPGVLAGDDKWRMYANADVFCFPSFFDAESFGLVNVEAMMFRLPVVSTRWRGIPTVVRDGETGLLAPVRDAQAIAGCLERILADPALRDRMGAAGRRAYEERFHIDRWRDGMAAAFALLREPDPRA